MPVDDVEQARINDRWKDSEIKMGKYKAVILDWAGTTVDYGCFAPVQAFVEVFKHFGIAPTMDEVREPMGMLKKDHIRTMLKMDRISGLWRDKYGRYWTEDDVEALYAQFEGKLLAILDGYTQVKPYVLETVDTLRKNGIQIGSTTGYTDKMMDIVVPKAKENGYAPDFWFSPDSVEGMGRPYPYMIFKNMAAMKIQSVDQVVKVGDTVSDIKEEDLTQIKEELIDGGYIRRKGTARKQKITSKPFHYLSSDGFSIYVGKNNFQNDELTFKFATGNDWWFHAKGIPGSHVVVSRPPEYASTTFLTSDIGTASVQTNLYTFRLPSCNFMIAASIVRALGKCVKSVLYIAAI